MYVPAPLIGSKAAALGHASGPCAGCVAPFRRWQVVLACLQEPELLHYHVNAVRRDIGGQIVEKRADALVDLDGACAPVADLVDGQSDVVVPGWLRHDDSDPSLDGPGDTRREPAIRKSSQEVKEMIETLRRGCWVVDSGGEGALSDVNQLSEAEGGVLDQVTLLVQGDRLPDLAVLIVA